jgi:hypothetical protein
LSSIKNWLTVLPSFEGAHEDLQFDSSQAQNRFGIKKLWPKPQKKGLTLVHHFEAAFVRRIFSIHSMAFQKVGILFKIISLPRSWLSRLVKSIPELPIINTGKRTANKEITLVALIPSLQFCKWNSE